MNSSHLFAVLSWILPLYAVFSLTAMAGMNLSFLAVFLCYLTAVVTRMPPRLRLHEDAEYQNYRFWALALLITCLLSLIVAKFWPVTYAGTAPEITTHGFFKIWYMIIPAVLVHVVYRITQNAQEWMTLIRRTLLAWFFMILFLAGIAMIQYFTGWPPSAHIPYSTDRFHVFLFFGHHLSTASIIPFPTFCALGVALGEWARHRKIARLEWAVGICGLLIVFFSYARTSWLSLPIGIALLFSRYLNRKQIWASCAAFIVLALVATTQPLIKARIQSNAGILDRTRLWEANIDFFKHNPLTGIGWLKNAEMSEFYFKQIDPQYYHSYFWGHAHNNFFEMLGGTGLLGLIAFLGWSWFTLRLGYRTSRKAEAIGQLWISDLSWGLFTGLILLHFNGLTNVTFWEGKVMHQQMIAVGLLLVFSRYIKSLSSS